MNNQKLIFLKIFVILSIAFVLCEANQEAGSKKDAVKADPIKVDEGDKDYSADEEPEAEIKEHLFPTKRVTTIAPVTSANKASTGSKAAEKPTVKVSQLVKDTTESQIIDEDINSDEYKEYDVGEIQDSEDAKARDKKYMEVHIFEDSVGHSPIFTSSGMAALFAATILILSIMVYGGLILWRKRLDQRYGMRERLVTNDEDEVYRRTEIRYLRV